jgi:hypothetical protein
MDPALSSLYCTQLRINADLLGDERLELDFLVLKVIVECIGIRGKLRFLYPVCLAFDGIFKSFRHHCWLRSEAYGEVVGARLDTEETWGSKGRPRSAMR